MNVDLPDDMKDQSVAAGFSSVEQYIYSLVERDRERLAIEEGIRALREGRTKELRQFDSEFRKSNGLEP